MLLTFEKKKKNYFYFFGIWIFNFDRCLCLLRVETELGFRGPQKFPLLLSGYGWQYKLYALKIATIVGVGGKSLPYFDCPRLLSQLVTLILLK